jgi:hypothetical protein
MIFGTLVRGCVDAWIRGCLDAWGVVYRVGVDSENTAALAEIAGPRPNPPALSHDLWPCDDLTSLAW